MGFFIGTDVSSIELFPEYTSSIATKQIRSDLRTRCGAMYTYKWGQYLSFTISCRFVPSSDALTINEWWDNNEKLIFTDANSSMNVFIMNLKTPFDKFEQPMSDVYKGKLTVEGR